MEQHSQLPSFTEVEWALDYLKALGTAAETHGMLCALLSCGTNMRPQAWLNSLLNGHANQTDAEAKNAQKILSALFAATTHNFESDEYELNLLLPNDEADFEKRIDSLAQWCQGYISGLNLMGIPVQNHPNPEVKEALDDIMEFSCLEYQGEEQGEQHSETAYVELIEYIRMAVMMISNEFHQQFKPSSGQASDKLH